MHSSGSILYTVIERIHGLVDEAVVGAKFTDDYLVRHVVQPSAMKVLARIHNTSSARVIQKLSLTLDPDQDYYKLPPCVQKVMRVLTVDTDDQITGELIPRDMLDWRGETWRIEGNPGTMELFFSQRPLGTSTLEVWYVPNGDSLPHYATTGSASSYVFSGTGATWDEATLTLTSSGTFTNYTWVDGDMLTVTAATGGTLGDYEIASRVSANAVTLKAGIGSGASGVSFRTWTRYLDLATSPTVGGVDRRESAYLGQVCSFLPTGAATRLDSRLISSHTWNVSKWTVGFRRPMDAGATPGAVVYEVAPPTSSLLADAVACMGAQTLGAYRKISRAAMEQIQMELRISLKTVGDLVTNVEGRQGKYVARATVDRDPGMGWGFIVPQ